MTVSHWMTAGEIVFTVNDYPLLCRSGVVKTPIRKCGNCSIPRHILFMNRLLLLICVCAIGASGCNRRSRLNSDLSSKSPEKSQSGSNATLDASNLLTGSDIQSVLHEALTDKVGSSHSESGFDIAQCYFTVSVPSKSVVVTVTSRGKSSEGKDPRDFWFEKFHPDKSRSNEKEEGEEEARDSVPPSKVEGVGEEAFWVRTGSLGALYALQRDKFIRVAIGGADDEPTRKEKSATLARLALKAL